MKFSSIAQTSAIAVLLLSSTVEAIPFQLKGMTLGSTPEVACGSAPITDSRGDLIKKYKAEAPQLDEMGTKECGVEINTFGGSKTSSTAKLLFLDGKLILLKIELFNLALADFVEILKAMTADYGKPKRTISRPFVTDTWKADGATLLMERVGREWDDNHATIILRHDSAYSTYERRNKANLRILEALDRSAVKKDIR